MGHETICVVYNPYLENLIRYRYVLEYGKLLGEKTDVNK